MISRIVRYTSRGDDSGEPSVLSLKSLIDGEHLQRDQVLPEWWIPLVVLVSYITPDTSMNPPLVTKIWEQAFLRGPSFGTTYCLLFAHPENLDLSAGKRARLGSTVFEMFETFKFSQRFNTLPFKQLIEEERAFHQELSVPAVQYIHTHRTVDNKLRMGTHVVSVDDNIGFSLIEE